MPAFVAPASRRTAGPEAGGAGAVSARRPPHQLPSVAAPPWRDETSRHRSGGGDPVVAPAGPAGAGEPPSSPGAGHAPSPSACSLRRARADGSRSSSTIPPGIDGPTTRTRRSVTPISTGSTPRWPGRAEPAGNCRPQFLVRIQVVEEVLALLIEVDDPPVVRPPTSFLSEPGSRPHVHHSSRSARDGTAGRCACGRAERTSVVFAHESLRRIRGTPCSTGRRRARTRVDSRSSARDPWSSAHPR